MIACLLALSLFCGFNMKWYLPQGVSGFGNTKVIILDTDRDGNWELMFTTYGAWPYNVFVYELHLPNSWEVDSIPHPGDPLLWDGGDFDLDGLYDLVLQFGYSNPLTIGIMIFESPDSFSYPTQEVWRDTIGSPSVAPISACDIDQDGFPEIIKQANYGIDIVIYESDGDNSYVIVYEDTINIPGTALAITPFADFDGDGKIEFVLANLSYGGGAGYWLYESPANNIYEFIYLDTVPTANIKDCFSVPDADGDGKLEFVVKGFEILSAEIHAFICEATGDNTYEIIKTFTLPGGDYYGGYSDAGDVDGDGIPEIALEGRQTVHIIKAAGNDSFYVWETLPGHANGSCVRVFDLDGNGLSEVIISGNNETRIYEYEVSIAETTNVQVQRWNLDIHPNPFMQFLNIGLQNPSEKEVAITIYDVAGRLIKILHKGTTDRDCTLIWHGDDEQGRAVAPGIYFVRLEAADYSATEKVLLIR